MTKVAALRRWKSNRKKKRFGFGLFEGASQVEGGESVRSWSVSTGKIAAGIGWKLAWLEQFRHKRGSV